MKHYWILCVVGVGLLGLLGAFRPLPAPGGLRFEPQHLDLPTLDEDAYYTYYFRYTNTGSAPVRIVSIENRYDCLEITPPAKPTAPGATDSIKVVFATHNRLGPNYKSFTVITDENLWSFYILSLRAHINLP